LSPRADFICLSKKCATPEGAPAYELPVNAVCCPACGSKRIKRLFNSVNISHGVARKVDAIAERPITEALAKRDEIREKARLYPMVNAVPMRQLGANLQQVYMGSGAAGVPSVDHSALTRKADLGGSLPAVVQDLQSARMPRNIAAVDREYTLKRGPDGPTIEKA
jgi:hypothetical protein